MADIRESFPTTENGAGVGVPLTSSAEGDSAATKNASTALVAKDSSANLAFLRAMQQSDPAAGLAYLASMVAKDPSGNLQLLRQDAAGYLLTTEDGGGVPYSQPGRISGTTAMATVAEIGLVAGDTYRSLEFVGSCFRDAWFEILYVDDPSGTPVETIIAEALVGPGCFTAHFRLQNVIFTAPATSPVLRVRAKNMNSLSDIRATISIVQDAA